MNDLGTWVDFSSSAGSLDSIKTHYEGVITFPGKLQDIHSHFHPFPRFLRKLYRLEQVSFSSSHYYYFYFIFLGYKCLSRKPNHSSSVPQNHVRVRRSVVSVIPGYPRVEMGCRGRRIRAASLGYTVTERQILSQTRWISENWVLRVVPCPLHMTTCPHCYRETSSHPTQHSTHIHTKQGILVWIKATREAGS